MQAVYIRSDIHCISVVHLVASDNQTGFSKKNILPYQFFKFCYKFYYLNHFKMYSSGASLVAQMVKKKICLQCGRWRFSPWFGKISWRRKWLPTPIFLPKEFHGQRSLVGYSPWDLKELDTTEQLTLSLSVILNTNLDSILKSRDTEAVLRCRRNRTGRPLSPQQIHQKNIWTLSKFHKTTSECWQRTSGTQKSSPLSSKGDRKKKKKIKRETKDVGMEIRPRKGLKKERSFQTPGNTLTGDSVASLGTTEGNITGRKINK